jgi:hypothetical protein
VVSPVELLGIRSAMSEDELIQIVGDHPVHMTPFGYMKYEKGNKKVAVLLL